jgi:hypothetical protein
MPLCNITVSKRIGEIAKDVGTQFVEKLRSRKFSVQMDDSTVRNTEAVLMVYVRYIDHGDFSAEMMLWETLETVATANDTTMCNK